MDSVADDVAILNRDKIDGVVVCAVDVAVFDVDVLGLIDLQSLVCNRRRLPLAYPATAIEFQPAHQDVITLLEMERVTRRRRPDCQIDQVEVAAVEDVEITLEYRCSATVCTLEDDREGCCSIALFEVVWEARLRVVASRQHDPAPGTAQRRA